MKKYFLLSFLTLVLISCSNAETLHLENFIPAGKTSYSGGFENSGYTLEILNPITSSNNTKIITVIQRDTATITNKVYEVNKDQIRLVFVGEENTPYIDGNKNRDEIILKTPISVGNSWISQGFKYEIIQVIQKDSNLDVTVRKTSIDSPEYQVDTTYRYGVGILK